MWSQIISLYRFPMCVLVVFIHTTFTMEGDFLQIAISHVLSQAAVPSFFFFSGFLFFHDTDVFNRAVYFYKIRKRFYSLVIPYFMWISIWIGIKLLLLCKNHGDPNEFFGIESWYDWPRLLWDSARFMTENVDWIGNPVYITAPVLVPLWYLRDLIVVSLHTPILFYLINVFKELPIVFFALAYITHIWPIHSGITNVALFFFSFGAYFSIIKMDFVALFRRFEYISYSVFVILFVVEIAFDGSHTSFGFFIHPFFVVSEFVSLVCIG